MGTPYMHPIDSPVTMYALLRILDIAIGELCPECGSTLIDDNGLTGRRTEYRCSDCSHVFGPGSEI